MAAHDPGKYVANQYGRSGMLIGLGIISVCVLCFILASMFFERPCGL